MKEELRLISVLLRYPTSELKELIESIQAENPYIDEFLNYAKGETLLNLQTEYVKSFDLSDKSTLYLTYHRFRDDPKRGTFLVKLVDYYRKKDFEFVDNELPDFLPVVLEFCSYMDETTALEILSNFQKELSQIEEGLKEQSSKYTPLISYINELIKREVNQNA